MATELTTGTIPTFYREVYELCLGIDNTISGEMFSRILVKSGLPSQTLDLITSEVELKQGALNRTRLYKVLALIALAQQGKVPRMQLVYNCSGDELPSPQLGPLSDLAPVPSYRHVCLIDMIEVNLVPEKKGLFLKHVEYQVTSQRLGTSVRRRYNDFVLLREALLARFPYRLVPKLPVKKIVIGDAHFLQERCRALRRWLTLVARHPIMHRDPLLVLFLRHPGSDLQHRVRDAWRRVPDEFTTSQLAACARELAPSATKQAEVALLRDEINSCHKTVLQLHHVAQNIAERGERYSADMAELSSQLKSVAQRQSVSEAAGSSAWDIIKRSFQPIAKALSVLSLRAARCTHTELSDQVQLLLDVLAAHTDLYLRHEKGVAQDHARALSMLLTLKRKQTHGPARLTEVDTVNELETCMMHQDDIITDVQLRDAFSLHCLHMETQLVHSYLELLAQVMATLVRTQADTHAQLCEVWQDIETSYLPSRES